MNRSLWDIAIDKANTEEAKNKTTESSVFFIGSKGAGKTTISLRCMDKDESPKPTTALEYTFGRKSRGSNLAMKVGHVWELGGGSTFSNLMDIVITPANLMDVLIVLVLDLSEPSQMWVTMETLLKAVRQSITKAIREASDSDRDIKQKLEERMRERLGKDNPDSDLTEPILLPIAIIGSKYDVFQNYESETRKSMCKFLRFIAHTHGASLQFFSIKQEALVTKAKGLVGNVLFGMSLNQSLQVDPNKPLMVPFGKDSFDNIGPPPISDGDIGKGNPRSPMELWKRAYVSLFPQTGPAQGDSQKVNPSSDPQYREPIIDDLRARKEEELVKYRKASERKMKEAREKAKREGIL